MQTMWVKIDDLYISFDKIIEVNKFYIKTITNETFNITEETYKQLVSYMRIIV